MWTGDCVRSKEGLHPTLNNLGLESQVHISPSSSVPCLLPNHKESYFSILLYQRTGHHPFPFPTVQFCTWCYFQTTPWSSVEEQAGQLTHPPAYKASGTPFYTWARLLFSSSCIRSFHHTFPQSTEMLCGGEFLFSTHHWGDMWLKKMTHLTCSGWKRSVM